MQNCSLKIDGSSFIPISIEKDLDRPEGSNHSYRLTYNVESSIIQENELLILSLNGLVFQESVVDSIRFENAFVYK
jgi:hypothetical protein